MRLHVFSRTLKFAAKVGFAGLIGASLSGCVGTIKGSADLAGVTPSVTPLSAGVYSLNPAGAKADNTLQISLEKSKNRIRYHAADDNNVIFDFEMFGPVSGLYVVEMFGDDEKTRDTVESYSIWKETANGDFAGVESTSEGSLSAALGHQLFDQLGLAEPDDVDVSTLTDNATINWAILQRLIIDHAGELTFGDTLTRVRQTK